MGALKIADFFERSRSFFPRKTALIFIDSENRESVFTYDKLSANISLAVKSLKIYTIKEGERICLLMPNSPEFIFSYLANSRIGATSVLLNPALPPDRIKKILNDTDASLIIRRIDGRIDINTLTRTRDYQTESVSAVLYSSGTTGEQKGIKLSASNIYNNIKYTNSTTGMTPEDRAMCFLPLTHCFGLNFILGTSLFTGATLVLHEKFDLKQVLDSLVRNKVTMFFAVPAVYNMMLKQKIDPFYFSSVRYFFYAADSMSQESLEAWEQEYGRKIYTAWGLTETSPLATSNHEAVYRFGSVGKPIPGVEIKIKKPHSEHYGEICVRGHNVMEGYWNRPFETSQAIDSENWFHTGDVGCVDNDGYLFVVDRLKDMINVGGEKAWPAEIEKRILQHPDITEVGVVGVPHPEMREVPKAFVVSNNPALTKEDIQVFIKPMLMRHEFPREIEFIDKLPRNPSGKILRRELRNK